MSTDVMPVERRRGPNILQPLRIRDFRLVFGGETISQLGDQFHFIALAWLTLTLTGSGLALGSVLLVAGIPRAVFMLLGGVLSDRMSPRTLMLASNILRSVLVAGLTVLVVTQTAELWHLFVVALAFGVVDAFFWPALNTFVPMAVEEDDLPAANALLQSSQSVTQLAGPLLAGLVVATAGMGWAFGFDAISFAVAAVALALVTAGRRPPPADGETHPSILHGIREGLAFVWNDRGVRAVTLLSMAFNFAFTGPINVGLAYLANQRFTSGAAGFGLVLAAFGGSALVGAIVAGSLGRVRELGWVTLGVSLAMGLGIAAIGFASEAWVAAAMMIPIGLGAGLINVMVVAWMQRRTPEALRGRAMSVLSLGGVSLAPISMAAAGAIADLGAASAVFIGAGALVLITAAAALVWGLPAAMRDA